MAVTKKGEQARMKKKRPMVLLPEDLHYRLRLYALEHGRTVKEIVGEAVSEFLERGSRGKK